MSPTCARSAAFELPRTLSRGLQLADVMSGTVFHRIIKRILGKEEAVSTEETGENETPPANRDSVASDVDSKRWFAGVPATPPRYRDPVDSSPDTSRWFRRPKFVAPGDSLHHPSDTSARRKGDA